MILQKEASIRIKICIISTFLWGILAHGIMLFNKISFHDDAGLFYIGGTYPLGRWMLGVLESISEWFWGNTTCSLPLFNGAATLLFIAVSVAVLVELFEVKNKLAIVALSGTMAVFPAVTSTLGFMFTAPYYFLGTLFGVFGVALSCKAKKWYTYLAGIVLMGCAVGVYQANIPVCVCIILFYAIKKTAEKKHTDWKEFIILGIKSVVSCGGFMAVYFICNQIALRVTGSHLSDYQRINDMGQASVKTYLKRIFVAYREFFVPTDGTMGNMYPFSSNMAYKLFVLLLVILTVYLLYSYFRKEKWLGLQMAVFVVFVPLAVNFIYVMCDPNQVDGIMAYGEVMVFVYAVWLISRCMDGHRLVRRAGSATVILVCVLAVMLARFDNLCYLKAQYMQTQGISYFTTLITQIKSTEGFTQNTPVVYINEYGKYDYTTASIPEFKEIKLTPFEHSSILNDYAWKITMKMWCDFDPTLEDASEYENLPEVQEMPCYPDTGSIHMMDGVLIVKF